MESPIYEPLNFHHSINICHIKTADESPAVLTIIVSQEDNTDGQSHALLSQIMHEYQFYQS